MEHQKKGDRVTVQLTGEPPFNGVIIGETSDGQAWHIVRTAPNFRAESIRASVGRKSPIRNNAVSRARAKRTTPRQAEYPGLRAVSVTQQGPEISPSVDWSTRDAPRFDDRCVTCLPAIESGQRCIDRLSWSPTTQALPASATCKS
jgi:hypothetical protein